MVRPNDPWRADEMDREAGRLDWAAKDAKDAPKPVGNFDDDYEVLCRMFQVPGHPCLVSRCRKESEEAKPTTSNATKQPIQFRNFTLDLTTLHLMMEALKRSSDVDTAIFHNAGLTRASIEMLTEGMEHTSIRCLSLDYNASPPSSFPESPPSPGLTADQTEGGADDAPSSPSAARPRNFAGLLREGSKLRELSLRGDGIGDAEAAELARAIEANTVLCSLNLFDNMITDVGAAALAETLRLNTVLRGLSLSKNRLTSASAEAFGLLLAGGYEILPAELEKRAAAETKIAAQNKIAQDAMKKKKDANVETRLPLSAATQDSDGRTIAGGNRSLAALNLADNPDLGEGGALAALLMRMEEARRREGNPGGAATTAAVVLQELHLTRCQGRSGGGDEEEEGRGGGGQAGLIAAAALALRPTKIVV